MSPILDSIGSVKSFGWGAVSEFVGTPSFESIATVSVGAGGTSNIDFNSIPSTYQHLQIRGIYKTNRDADSQMYTRFNGDATNNYSYHGLSSFNGATPTSGGSGTLNVGGWGNCGPTAANIFTTFIMDILDYTSANKNKTVRISNGFDTNGGGLAGLFSFEWRSTAAISSIRIFCANSGVTQQYSHFALYGIKAAA